MNLPKLLKCLLRICTIWIGVLIVHLLYTSKELYKDKLFADVTLLSDDLIQMKAHKTVLSSASEFFKQLFTENESLSV